MDRFFLQRFGHNGLLPARSGASEMRQRIVRGTPAREGPGRMEGQGVKRMLRWVTFGMALMLVLAAGLPARGQSAAEQGLLQKAPKLEQSGHMDLAAQTWQQVLLSDPNNQEALAGLGRWAKLSGNDAEAEKYVE